MNIDLVKNSLEYYDSNREKYESFTDKLKYLYFVKKKNDMDHDVVVFYDKNKKQVYKSRFENIGSYTNQDKTWKWSWSNPKLRKINTYTITKVLNYGIQLNPKDQFLKTELITSKFRIDTKIQIEIHVAVSSYLAKKGFIIGYLWEPDDVGKIIAESENSESAPKFKFLKFDDDKDLDNISRKAKIFYFYVLDPPNIIKSN